MVVVVVAVIVAVIVVLAAASAAVSEQAVQALRPVVAFVDPFVGIVVDSNTNNQNKDST